MFLLGQWALNKRPFPAEENTAAFVVAIGIEEEVAITGYATGATHMHESATRRRALELKLKAGNQIGLDNLLFDYYFSQDYLLLGYGRDGGS